MTRDDIIRMAREASGGTYWWPQYKDTLERFATLVAAAEREACAQVAEKMTRDDMNRWEAEIDGWRQRYEALLKTLADQRSLMPPRLLGDKESYELGRLHGAAAEREACARLCADYTAWGREWGQDNNHMAAEAATNECAAAIRARGKEK